LARGGLTQATSSVAATRSALSQARAEVESAEAADRLAQAEWTRAQDLAKADAIARADVDSRRARSEQARAALDQAQEQLAQAGGAVARLPDAGQSAYALMASRLDSQALIRAFNTGFLVLAAVFALSFLLVFLLRKPKGGADVAAAAH
jgi:multidrug resistance efflux pump